MSTLNEQIHEICTPEKLEEIIEKTDAAINRNYKALSERAQGMADARTYQELIDYCFEQTTQYIDNRDNMMKVLTDTRSIQPVYNSIANTEEFAQICAEEYKGFPRVILMTILSGAFAAAANEACLAVKEQNADVASYFDSLVDVYQKYLQDALAYGKGEDKKVVMTGHRQ